MRIGCGENKIAACRAASAALRLPQLRQPHAQSRLPARRPFQSLDRIRLKEHVWLFVVRH